MRGAFKRIGARVVATTMFLGCGGAERTAPETPEPPASPSMRLVTTTTSLVAARSANAIVRLYISRGGAYSGSVAISTSPLPPGVSASLSRPSLVPANDTSVLNLEVDSTATPGSYSIMLRAAGESGLRDSAALSLNVPTPMISVNIAPPTQSLVPGTSARSLAVNVARANGFFGPVTLSTFAPAGVTATLQPATIPTGVLSSTLVVSGHDTLPNGPVTVQVFASGFGVATTSMSVVMNVAAETRIFPNESRPQIAAGSRLQQTITLTRNGNLQRNVLVGVLGLPPGISASVSPAVVTSTQHFNDLILTVDVAADVAVGVYPITLTSTFQGSDIGRYEIGMLLNVTRP